MELRAPRRLTADAMAGEDSRLIKFGFNGVQPKPIRPGDLIRAIADVRALDLVRRPQTTLAVG